MDVIKKFIVTFLGIFILTIIIPDRAYAADPISPNQTYYTIGSVVYNSNNMTLLDSGYINSSTAYWIVYQYESEYILVVEGDYNIRTEMASISSCPWQNYRSQITKVFFGPFLEVENTSLAYVFYNHTALTDIVFSYNFKISSSNMGGTQYGMFCNCTSLETLDMTGLLMDNVTDMSYFVSGCTSLQSIIFTDAFATTFNSSSWQSAQLMFQSCAFKTIDLSALNFGSITKGWLMFNQCDALEEIKTPLNLAKYIDLPETAGYVWYDVDNTSKTYLYLPQNQTESITLKRTNGYIVTFCDYDGTSLGRQAVWPNGTAVYEGTTPTRASSGNTTYTFDKWVTTAGGTTAATLTGITGNKTVYASYKETTAAKITFDSCGGSAVSTVFNIFYGDTIGMLPTTIRDGYTFNGWKTSSGIVITNTTVSTFTVDTILYAAWTVNDSFMAALPSTIELTYDPAQKRLIGNGTIDVTYRIQTTKALTISISVSATGSKIRDSEQNLEYGITATYEDGTISKQLTQTDEQTHTVTLPVKIISEVIDKTPHAGSYQGQLNVTIQKN